MLIKRFQTSPLLRVLHCTTSEELRSFEPLSETNILPLTKWSSSALALVTLPTCCLVVQRTFPRVSKAKHSTDGLLCVIPLTALSGFKFNGAAVDTNSVVIVRSQAECYIVEPHPTLFAIVCLNAEHADRGWPLLSADMQIARPTYPTALHKIRVAAENLLVTASRRPPDLNALNEMERMLLSSLDEAVNASSVSAPPRAVERYRDIVELIDEYANFYPDADARNSDLASYCQVSPRTLQTAIATLRGMSLHRYLRLRKLWLVRQTLTVGRLDTIISDVARANGFRHMGEFAKAYRSAFGETASTTLVRSQRPQNEADFPPLAVAYDPDGLR